MNKKCVLSLLAMVLTLGLASCDNDTGGGGETFGPASSYDDFQGLWIASNSRYSFTGNTFQYNDNFGISRPGTFTFTGNRITFIPQQANTWIGYTLDYQISGTTLVLTGSTDPTSGTFTRQPGPRYVAANPAKGFNYGYY